MADPQAIGAVSSVLRQVLGGGALPPLSGGLDCNRAHRGSPPGEPPGACPAKTTLAGSSAPRGHGNLTPPAPCASSSSVQVPRPAGPGARDGAAPFPNAR